MAGSYVNFYIGNGFVVLPQFGCPEDEVAKEILQHHMSHTVFGVNTRGKYYWVVVIYIVLHSKNHQDLSNIKVVITND